MLQLMMIMISIKKLTFNCNLRLSKICRGSSDVSMVRPSVAQQALAISQSRKNMLDSFFMALRTEHAEVRREMHVLPSQNVTSAKSVVNEQKKTLWLCWQDDFQIHLKIGCD